MEKIKRVSLALKWVVLAFLAVLVGLDVVFWGLFDPSHEFYRQWLATEVFSGDSVTIVGGFWPVLLAFLSTLPGVVMYAASLAYLARLFSLYSKGIIFTEATVRCMRLGGWCLLFGQAAKTLALPLLTLSLTMNNPPGEHRLFVGLEDTEITGTAAAVAVILVSWVMDEGRKLREELELTV